MYYVKIIDTRGNEITDNGTADDDDTIIYYDPVGDASDTYDAPPEIPDKNSADYESIYNLEYDNSVIIPIPSIVDHYCLISGVENNHNNKHNPEAEPPELASDL